MNVDEAKIIRFVNTKLTEVIDYDRDDYEHLIEEKKEN